MEKVFLLRSLPPIASIDPRILSHHASLQQAATVPLHRCTPFVDFKAYTVAVKVPDIFDPRVLGSKTAKTQILDPTTQNPSTLKPKTPNPQTLQPLNPSTLKPYNLKPQNPEVYCKMEQVGSMRLILAQMTCDLRSQVKSGTSLGVGLRVFDEFRVQGLGVRV